MYRRYVDDIICIFNIESDADKCFEFLNTQHLNIKFTFEKQVNKLNYSSETCGEMRPTIAKFLCKHLELYLNDSLQHNAEVMAFSFKLLIDLFILLNLLTFKLQM